MESVPLWRIALVPGKLESWSAPVLFIDDKCSICIRTIKRFKKLDVSDNVKVKSLDDVTIEGHEDWQSLAQSKTTIILAEPRIGPEGSSVQYLYSMKGRAILRLFGYTPFPLCFIAAFEGLPGSPSVGRLVLHCLCLVSKALLTEFP